jgi:YHS domain-containing protein
LPSLKKKTTIAGQKMASVEDLIEDPQCHAYIPKSTAYTASINGKGLYFCSRTCYEQYKEKMGQ